MFTRIIFNEECKHDVHSYVVFSNFLLPRTSWTQIPPSARYSRTPSAWVPLCVSGQVSQPNKPTGEIIVTTLQQKFSQLLRRRRIIPGFIQVTPSLCLSPLIPAATTMCRSLRYTNPRTLHVGSNFG
jgi:hypothetical protein